jgi:hypothetical protein
MSRRQSEYEVGYGKPPQDTRFRNGCSGNPRGRPKGTRSLGQLLHQACSERIVIRENGERRTITKLEAALKQLVNKAASGEARAIRDLIKLQADIAQLETAEERSRNAAKEREHEEPPDPAKIALCLLGILRAGSKGQRDPEAAEPIPVLPAQPW